MTRDELHRGTDLERVEAACNLVALEHGRLLL